MKYRKLPVVIEAEQWFPGCDIESVKPLYSEGIHAAIARTCEACEACGCDMSQHGLIDIPDEIDQYIVCPGDYIITGIKGEKYPCKPDIFKRTHTPVRVEAND
jgi:hypothetical protein